MATKTKPSRSKITNKRVKSSSSLRTFNFNRKTGLILIAVFAVLGTIVILSANAATSGFEAESAELSKTIKKVDGDNTASAGKYIEFQSAKTITTNTQRFPGDPNPLATGKAYWGGAIGGNSSPSKYESPTKTSLSIRRTYWDWSKRPQMIQTAKDDIAANRLPFISTKTPGWADMASGKRDSEIDDTLRKLDALGGPVWLVVHHEPEGGAGSNSIDDSAGAAGWIKMQKKIRERMDALGTKNIAFVSNLMTWTWDSRSGRNPEDWWAPNVWDVYTANIYCEQTNCRDKGLNPLTQTMWKNFEKWANSKKIPYGVGEWGIHGQDAAGAQIVQNVWDHGFTNNKDLVAWAYFDSSLNAPTGSWELTNQPLAKYNQILKDDQRVQRIKDLQNITTTTTASNLGTVKAKISVAESGNYKLWIRMKASDNNNNSVQAQVDNGAVIKVGDSDITPNTWTWVDWKNGNIKDTNMLALSSGEHTITLTGTEKGVKIDRVLITDENCLPKDFGDNCANPTKPQTQQAPTIKVTTPSGPVKGTVDISVTADQSIKRVSFRPDNVWAATVDSSPFTFKWDTTKYPNGIHSFVVRTTITGDSEAYREDTVYINIQNTKPNTPTEPTPAPQPTRDSEKPTTPQNLKLSLNLNLAKFIYEMGLNWSPATDNVGVVGYQVSRNGENLANIKTNNYKDLKNLKANQTYTYSVIALDEAGNKSNPTTITAKTKCTLIWCSLTVL